LAIVGREPECAEAPAVSVGIGVYARVPLEQGHNIVNECVNVILRRASGESGYRNDTNADEDKAFG